MSSRLPWGHKSRHCIYCGKVGPRVSIDGFRYAHRRCINKRKPVRRPASMNLPPQSNPT